MQPRVSCVNKCRCTGGYASTAPAALKQIIAIAAEYGFKLTKEDLEVSGVKEMSDDELDAMAGAGAACTCTNAGYGDAWGDTEGSCWCAIAGASDFYDKGSKQQGGDESGVCACFSVGGGGAS